jgi:hypothetical protein
MASEGGGNIQRLGEAGFEIKSPLPSEYEEVFEGMSDEEVELLIGLKQRFDEAEASTERAVGPYKEYFWPF